MSTRFVAKRRRSRFTLLFLVSALVIAVMSSPAAAPADVTITEFAVPRPAVMLATGADDALWLTSDHCFYCVLRVTTSGEVSEFGPLIPGFNVIRDVAAGPGADVWFAAEGFFGRVSSDGSFESWEAPGIFPAQITAGPDGAMWFTDQANWAIGRVTESREVTEWAIPRTPAMFPTPWAITAGPDGALWFTERAPIARIGRITMDGTITEWAIPDPASDPFMIAAGPDGALWFTDLGTQSINRITTGGSLTTYPVPTPGSIPVGIAAGPDGALWYTAGSGGPELIGRVTTDGEITEFPAPTDTLPFDIAGGADGAMWFTEVAVNRVGRIALQSAPQVSGHGRFNTEGNGQVVFTLSNEQVSFDRMRGERFSLTGDVTSVTGSANEATLTGLGTWNGQSGYTFEASVFDKGGWGRLEDTISVVIRDPAGSVAFTSSGPQLLKQGDITVTPADSG